MADVPVQIRPVANIWVLALQGSYVKWTRVQPYLMAMWKPKETRDSKIKVEKPSLLLLAPNSKKQIRV